MQSFVNAFDRMMPDRVDQVFSPSPELIARSQMTMFCRHLEARTGQAFHDFDALHEYSIRNFRTFWQAFLQWSELRCSGSREPVCTTDLCETATFFPDLALNYAACLLGPRDDDDDDRPAVTARRSGGECRRLTRGALRGRVHELAQAMLGLGIRRGDRIVAILRNDLEAVVAALATAAIGATFSSVAPEMGVEAILERFLPLEPTLLMAHVAPRTQDSGTPVAARVAEVALGLRSLKAALALDEALPDDVAPVLLRMTALAASAAPAPAAWPDLPFNQPLFIMFSSGTTGAPKCIVHGAGGTLLEHLKEHRLHCDLRAGDKMFFQTSCSWMMWNWQLSALASGVEIVLYDGPISDPLALWRIVAEERVTVFGTSPAYLKLCEDAAIAPGRELDLSCLRSVLSTGSILHERQFRWVRDHVKPLPLQSISGGTDIIGCFLLGNPNLPVIAGQSQCTGLGHDLRALPPPDTVPDETWPGSGEWDGDARVGELVCANPFPSRPLGFFGDGDGSRFHAAYFVQHPGFWAHGDLVEFTAEGGARLHGRADGVLKARGIRVGPAEIYRVLHGIPEIRDVMAVEQRVSAEFVDGRIILLLVLQDGLVLDGHLVAQLRRRLTEQASAAHVPDLFLQVDALPMTQNGKQSEAAASDLVNGRPVRNESALRNPEVLEALRAHPGLRPADMLLPAEMDEAADLERQLQRSWESLFACAPIGWEDDFFELGGNSLLAARLCVEIRQQLGHDLPLTAVHAAPTIGTLAALIRDKAGLSSPRLVLLHPGEGTPLFFVHSLVGTVTQFWALGRALRCRRPVYAIQARGIEPGEHAHQHVRDMAAEYLGIIRGVQPQGPYILGGFSFGGLVALEIAQQAIRSDETVAFLAMVDTTVHERFLPLGPWLRYRLQRPVRDLRRVLDVPSGRRRAYVAKKTAVLLDRLRVGLGGAPKHLDLVGDLLGDAHLPPNLRRVRGGAHVATRTYRPRPYEGRLTFFSAADRGRVDPLPLWRRIARGGVEVHVTPGDHLGMIQEPNVRVLAGRLDACLDGLDEPDPAS